MQNLPLQYGYRVALVAVTLFCLWSADGQAKTLSWTNPTANTDGSVYNAATDQAEAHVRCGNITIVSPGDAESVDYDFPPGSHDCVATVVNNAGVESGPSNTVTFVIASGPNPPTGLTVSDLTAYMISQSEDVVVLVPVGTVPVGTDCDETMTVNGMYRVPKDDLDPAGTADPPVIFAECSGGS